METGDDHTVPRRGPARDVSLAGGTTNPGDDRDAGGSERKIGNDGKNGW
jgi:hypothetical protein